jgi:hypothetical protein
MTDAPASFIADNVLTGLRTISDEAPSQMELTRWIWRTPADWLAVSS